MTVQAHIELLEHHQRVAAAGLESTEPACVIVTAAPTQRIIDINDSRGRADSSQLDY